MTGLTKTKRSPKRIVLFAGALLLVLGGSLALRVVNRISAGEQPAEEPIVVAPRLWSGPAPLAQVPMPRDAAPAELALPDWAMAGITTPVRFQTDLDLIAPLGNGAENAALWFADFARPGGARLDEFEQALRRAEEANREAARAAGLLPDKQVLLEAARAAGVLPDKQVLLADEPLLREAEPWADQATMRFYPDVFEFEGWQTQVPNLVMILSLAKSWIARGDSAEEFEAAMENYRRAIRLGRLLRQEDAVVINDLVGLACIRLGLQAMYERLVDAGDNERTLTVALALGEVAPQRLTSSQRLTSVDFTEYVQSGWFGVNLVVPDSAFHVIKLVAEKDPDRRFRFEALLVLNLVRFEGTRKQRRETLELLERLASDEDELVAGLAEWARDNRVVLSDHVEMRY